MKKIFSILFIILLLMTFLSCNIDLFAKEFKEINYSNEIRKPVVSGIFYPGSAEELKEKIENLLNKGKLYILVYGRPVAVHIDPIEKKPISHMLPGSETPPAGARGILNLWQC